MTLTLLQGAKPITIDDMCNVMTNESDNQLEMKRFATVNQMVLNSTNQTCLGYDYAKMINDMRKVDWNSTAAEGGKSFYFNQILVKLILTARYHNFLGRSSMDVSNLRRVRFLSND